MVPGVFPEEERVPRVIGVRLRHYGQVYDFEAADLSPAPGSWVVVDTTRGQDAGQVVAAAHEIAAEQVRGELKPVLREATPEELERMMRFREREGEVLVRAREKVAEMELPMRLVAAEYTYNGRSLTIYFTAEKRIDFRELVKKLARLFRTRIDLRQIGARDEARLLGGIGSCGRLLCCATFLNDFLRISVRMAKEQELPLSPMKISGVCGRLLCCLSYEYEQYRDIKEHLPAVGDEVVTLRGQGKVVSVNVPKETVTVEVRPELRVEATAAELDRAAQLEKEGRLVAVAPSYLDAPERPAAPVEEPVAAAPVEAPKKSHRRRRRRGKGEAGEALVSAAPPGQPAQQSQRARPGRGPARPSAAGGQATPSSSRDRRRRPRRRPPRGSSPQGA